jgi:hypothetical protein
MDQRVGASGGLALAGLSTMTASERATHATVLAGARIAGCIGDLLSVLLIIRPSWCVNHYLNVFLSG